MPTTPLIPPDDAAAAIRGLLPALASLTEAAVDICASADVLTRSGDLASLCRDAAALADAISLITGRSRS